jgi:hypothetical protein
VRFEVVRFKAINQSNQLFHKHSEKKIFYRSRSKRAPDSSVEIIIRSVKPITNRTARQLTYHALRFETFADPQLSDEHHQYAESDYKLDEDPEDVPYGGDSPSETPPLAAEALKNLLNRSEIKERIQEAAEIGTLRVLGPRQLSV